MLFYKFSYPTIVGRLHPQQIYSGCHIAYIYRAFGRIGYLRIGNKHTCFFKDRYLGFDDGIYGILRIIELLSHTDKKISELFTGVNNYFSTEEIKIRVTDDNKFDIVDGVIKYAEDKKYTFSLVDGIRVMFEDGWALVRASNTGPDLTVRFEAKSEKRLTLLKEEFIDLIDNLKNKY